jgi:hypothetical protein
MGIPSAASEHLPWEWVPAPIHDWAQSLVGPISVVTACAGGMSPGCVAVLHGTVGRVFVKAVGGELNDGTPALYRHEAAILALLPPVAYRPELRGVYDDGGWVAIALEAIDGEYPDLADDRQRDAVRAALAQQSIELANVRPPIGTLGRLAERWLTAWSDERTPALLPEWLRSAWADVGSLVADLPVRLPATQLVHWDARDDNLLIRPDGNVVILDWGMSRLGPPWADLLLLALRNPAVPEFDAEVDEIADYVGEGPSPDLVDGILLAFGARLAFAAAYRPEPAIPSMSAFRRQLSDRMLEGARRRLGR